MDWRLLLLYDQVHTSIILAGSKLRLITVGLDTSGIQSLLRSLFLLRHHGKPDPVLLTSVMSPLKNVLQG